MNFGMIIDFHTHIFPISFRVHRETYLQRDTTFDTLFTHPSARMSTGEELVAALDEAQIDAAVAMGIGWADRQMAMESNDYIIESVNRLPNRLAGFCSVNPAWGEDALREVERCARHGLKGIGELHPDTQGFDLGSKEALAPLMQVARELGLIVLTHSSEPVGHLYPGKGRTTPDVLYRFIKNFPENIIVCAHWGGGLPFYSLMPEMAGVLRNVYYDTAASPLLYKEEVFHTVVELTGSDRILFGTDFPLIAHRRLLEQIETSPLSGMDTRKILGNNAQSLLGI